MKQVFVMTTVSWLALASAPALAQADPVPTGSVETPAKAADGGLGEIVVTAQKRAENLQRVPIAVIAKTEEQLTGAGVVSTQQLGTIAPGLNVRTTVGAYQPYIRGIGTSSSVVENPVALYIDGVYLPQQREGVRDLNDIAQVAVLKGPQGTLFGRNSTGGVIQITTKEPSDTFGTDIRLRYQNYETVHADAYLTGPIAEGIKFSASAAYTTQGQGWGTNFSTGNDTYKLDHQFDARAKLLIEPGPNTSFLLIGDYMDRAQHAFALQPYPGTTLSVQGRTTPSGQLLSFGPVNTVYDTYSGLDPSLSYKGGGVSLTATQNFDFAKLISISSYRDGNGTYNFDTASVSPVVLSSQAYDQPSTSYSQELQLVSNSSGPLKWATGAFYFHYSNANLDSLRVRVSPITSPGVSLSQGKEVTESIAPFAQVDWEIFPNTTLTGGLRYTWEKRSLTGSINRSTSLTNPVFGPATTPRSQSTEKLTYRIALSQQFTPRILGYASFNTGFKSGGYNINSPTTDGYLPETLNAYEVGVKSELFDRSMRFNVAGFYYDYKNIQVTQLFPGGSIVTNGAQAEVYGVDVDASVKVATGLELTGAMEWLHAKFTDYKNAPYNTYFVNPGMIVGNNNAVIGTGDATGNRLPLSQKFTASGSLDYDFETSIGAMHFNLTGNYNGAYFFEADNYLRQPAYVLLNSSLRWTSPDDKLSFTVFGRNLLDKKVITYAATVNGLGYPVGYGSEPRVYGVTLGYKY
ncbi:TonB-dependent receptor [Sphingobium fuliginis]|nr:TonB-dependent receptor [Sphingobium fuliginis]